MAAALGSIMRTTDIALLEIEIAELSAVTGGCHKGPPPQPAEGPSVDVTVATGQAGGQAIQQALQGGQF